LPTLTEVVGDATSARLVASTSGAELFDESVRSPASRPGGGTAAGATEAVSGAGVESRGPSTAAVAPPARVSLTRKPRLPLPQAPASPQLPLLGMPATASQSRGVPPLAAAPSDGGLGADIFGDIADAAPAEGDDQLARAVLADLQRHVDQMLEYRLRASLTPLLTQMADNLVRELRQELASTLRDVVKRAVGQEVARRRKR
jgi:hypothetical protein